MMLRRITRIIVYSIISILIVFVFAISLPYSCSNIYDFPEPKPFSGNNLYNPYKNNSGAWHKANFHAHTKAWSGLTNGTLTAEELHAIYFNLGYSVIGISNYQSIEPCLDRSAVCIPLYEHGYNVSKRHQLSIGAQDVVWTDYILFQTLHHKQDILKRLRNFAPIVVITHPEFMDGYKPEDMQYLTDYDYIEILNHYRNSLAHWDSALSAGKKIFGMGNDDSHNQNNSDETGRFWTMLGIKVLTEDAVYEALRTGNVYSVQGNAGVNEVLLESCTVTGDTLSVSFNNDVKEIRFIGQNGKVRSTLSQGSIKTGTYVFTKDDAYIRIEAKTDSSVMYLNPIFRFEENAPIPESASVNVSLTVLYRSIFYIVYAATILILVRWIKRKKTAAKLTDEPRKEPAAL